MMRGMQSNIAFAHESSIQQQQTAEERQQYQPPPLNNQDEMTVSSMIGIGISCGILACIVFTICSERWDFFITKKILGRDSEGGSEGNEGDEGGGGREAEARRRSRQSPSRNQSQGQYLHNDEHSSDLSELVNEWESGSDDSLDYESGAREHGYWINAMIQELTAYKPSLCSDDVTELNMLPPMQANETVSCESSRPDEITTTKKDHCGIIQDEEDMGEDEEVDSKVAMVEPWFVSAKDEDVPLCKTIRKLLRVASGCSEDGYSKYSSNCSSLSSLSDEKNPCSESELGHRNDERMNKLHLSLVQGRVECNSDDSTVACGNVGKKRYGTDIQTEDTIDITDSEEDSLEQGDCEKVRAFFSKNLELWKKQRMRMCREISIVIPMTSSLTSDEIQSNDSCDSDSSLTVSDDDSQFGMIYGREEV